MTEIFNCVENFPENFSENFPENMKTLARVMDLEHVGGNVLAF